MSLPREAASLCVTLLAATATKQTAGATHSRCLHVDILRAVAS